MWSLWIQQAWVFSMIFASVVGSMCHGGNNQAASFRFIWGCSLMAGGHLEKPNGARAEMWILSISPTCPPVYLMYNLSRNNRLVEPNACIHPTPCIWDQLISLGVLGYMATLICAIRWPLQIECLFTYEIYLGQIQITKTWNFVLSIHVATAVIKSSCILVPW
jgi:hypothetical protein